MIYNMMQNMMMRSFKALMFSACTAGAILSAMQNASARYLDRDMAELRWMDKVTGRISSVTVPVGETGHISHLEVHVHACKVRPPEEKPEDAAFLEIIERKPMMQPVQVFSGWMFSSSPSLSAMDHPVHDIWVLRCFNQSETSEEQGAEAGKSQ
jgi:hypothetical protein